MKDYPHTIHTNLYSDKAFNILKRAFYLIEHERRYSKLIRRSVNSLSAIVAQEPDGEIVIKADTNYRTVFYRKRFNAVECLDWIGWLLKDLCYKSFDDDNYSGVYAPVEGRRKHIDWKRDNEDINVTAFTQYDDNDNKNITFTASVAEIYLIYDLFRNRKRVDSRFSKKLIDSIVGQKRDPLTAEAERARREEVARLEAECKQKVDECNWEGYRYNYYSHTQPAFVEMREAYVKLEEEFKMKARQLEETLGAKWKKRAIDIRKEYADKIADVNASVDALAMFA